jgi:hypothetical protein
MTELATTAIRAVLDSMPQPATLQDGTPRMTKDGRPLFRARVSLIWSEDDFRPARGNLTAPEFKGQLGVLKPIEITGLRANLYEIDGRPGWSLKADSVAGLGDSK